MHRHLGVRQLQEVHGVAEVSSGLRQLETGRKGSDVLPPLFFLIFFVSIILHTLMEIFIKRKFIRNGAENSQKNSKCTTIKALFRQRCTAMSCE